ncbi:MAG: metalloregulator ArsR/SmtB family transcription factor [Spirochaetales bacterium]|nr:metalloregulator ArsR/SmtB family transcription factor [Spirochaetales bacterium]
MEDIFQQLPPENLLNHLGEFFRILGDPTRIKILQALAVRELCVAEIAQLIGASQSAVSHQLKTLRQTNLVKYHKAGKTVFYALSDDHVTQILSVGLVHIQE